MPNPIHNVILSGTSYADAATISQVLGGNGGTFSIASGNVWAQLEYATPAAGTPRSGYGSTQWGTEIPMGTGPGFIPSGVTGIRFRNQDAATPATVSAVIVNPNEPYIFSSNSDVSVSGLSVNVQHNGVLVGTRPTVDFVDTTNGVTFAVTDDAANTRVTVSGNNRLINSGTKAATWPGGSRSTAVISTAHGLGVAPTGVSGVIFNPGSVTVATSTVVVASVDATNIGFQVFTTDGTSPAGGTAVSIMWIALA